MDYGAEVLRRFRAPARVGAFPPDASGIVAATAEDRSQNVWVRFQVRAEDRSIVDLRFNVYGCPHTVAAADWVAEQLVGRPTESLRSLDVRAAAEALELPREKIGKILRIEDALLRCAERIEERSKGSD